MQCNKLTQSMLLIDFFNSDWYLLRSDSKTSLITWHTLSQSHDFYVITLWMHFTLFISGFRKKKVIFYSSLNFPCVWFCEIIYNVFQVWFNFVSFDWLDFISIPIDTNFAMKTTHYYWFAIILFLLKKDS